MRRIHLHPYNYPGASLAPRKPIASSGQAKPKTYSKRWRAMLCAKHEVPNSGRQWRILRKALRADLRRAAAAYSSSTEN